MKSRLTTCLAMAFAAALLLCGCGKNKQPPLEIRGGKDQSTDVPPAAPGTLYGTWLNVYNSSSESWWRANDHYGTQVRLPDGSWGSMNWNDAGWRQMIYEDLIDAGIDFVIANNTDFLLPKTDVMVGEITGKPLKFCVAFGAAQLTGQTQVDWLVENARHPQYLHINGQPVLVCYVSKDNWLNVYRSTTHPKLKDFYRVWASGEDSHADKWGWQLEPEDGVMPSTETAFVTPAVKFELSGEVSTAWDRSLAMLDYTFWQSRVYSPNIVVVGSYDDPSERNSWIPMKTAEADGRGNGKFTPATGLIMYDPWTGGVAEPDVFRDRVGQWLSGGKLEVVPGGRICDGIYRIRNRATSQYLRSDADHTNPIMRTGASGQTTYDKFLVYHTGGNLYRIVNVYSGKPICEDGGGRLQTALWEKNPKGLFNIFASTTQDASAIWQFEPLATFSQGSANAACVLETNSGGTLTLDNGVPVIVPLR